MPAMTVGTGRALLNRNYTYVLNSITSAAVAFSVRRLRSDYAGPCLRLRRSTDDAESDFVFFGNDLDTPAIAAWLGGGVGYVRTWYDQSGNARHATQTTAVWQPQYAPNQQNGRPGLYYPTSTVGLMTPTFPHFPAKRGTLMAVARKTDTGFSALLSTYNQAAPNFILYLATSGGTFFKWFDSSVQQVAASFDTQSVTQTHVLTRTGDTAVTYHRNGALMAAPTATTNNQPADNSFIIGANFSAGTLNTGLVGDIFEAIEFSATLSAADRQAIEVSQRAYYGIA